MDLKLPQGSLYNSVAESSQYVDPTFQHAG
jgi:hypothetical protein